jgi:hypothetical protein
MLPTHAPKLTLAANDFIHDRIARDSTDVLSDIEEVVLNKFIEKKPSADNNEEAIL